jgi:hypothetical protein
LFEPVYGRAERCGVDFDDMDRHVAEKLGEPPLGCESPHEGAILKPWDHSRRHTPAKINPASRHDLKREITGFVPPYIEDNTQSCRREGISVSIFQCGFDDQRRAVLRPEPAQTRS